MIVMVDGGRELWCNCQLDKVLTLPQALPAGEVWIQGQRVCVSDVL